MISLPVPPKSPCGSCPYRRDVASGIWDRSEYEKLPGYDGETWEQSFGLFMCHQNDGCLCGGWLLTHDRDHLMALRLNRVDPSVWEYTAEVEVFGSGQEARDHGVRDLAQPSPEAQRKIAGLQRLQERPAE